MDRTTLLNAIQEYCKNNTSRQREDLYNYLNEKLGLSLRVYDYDGTGDHARFACDQEAQEHETDYLLKKLSK